jgi:hypothetical protein
MRIPSPGSTVFKNSQSVLAARYCLKSGVASVMNQFVRACKRSFVRANWQSPFLFLALLLTATSCTEGPEASAPISRTSARLNLRASFSASSASYQSAPINRIRLTVTLLPSGEVLPPFVFQDVNPNQPDWTLPIEFDLKNNTQVKVLAELISVTNGIETVEFSGEIGPFAVSTSAPTSPPTVPVFPGPPANLDIQGIQINPPTAPIVEGDQVTLTAQVQGGPANPTIVWSSQDPTIATIDANGLVRTLGPGSARIQASAGPRSANITLDVARRMARVTIAPASITLTSIGLPADYTAQVLDPRNAPFTGVPLVWTLSDPRVADEVSPGHYRSKASGTTNVTAAVQGNPALSATATLTVQQTPTRITISPSNAAVDALGVNTTFVAAVTDANNNPIANPAIQWSSSDQNVATIDGSGTATSRGNGRTTITARAGSLSATATLDVMQTAVRIDISPTSHVFTGLDQLQQFTASAFDANNQPVPSSAIVWGLESQGNVIEVTSTGLVRSVGFGTANVVAMSGNLRVTASVRVGGGFGTGAVNLVATGTVSQFGSNCIPFGNNTSYNFTGFIYRNVPAFTLQPGDRIAFDLLAVNSQDIRREIYFAAANINPAAAVPSNSSAPVSQGIHATNWVKVVSDTHIPLNPRGDSTFTRGNFELMYTAEAPFSFAGGGLIVGFAGSPPAAYADNGCEQMLAAAQHDDPSGYFYARFYYHSHLTTGPLDVSGNSDLFSLAQMSILHGPFSSVVVIPGPSSSARPKIVPIAKPSGRQTAVPRLLPGQGPGKEPPPPNKRNQ